MLVQIPASSILLEACRVFKAAQAQGMHTPKLFSREFKYDLFSKYRDVLSDNGIDSQVLGDILGNSARWDAVLNRFLVLNFLQFFGSRLSTSYSLDLMGAFATNTRDIKLSWYKPSEFSQAYAQVGPTLSIGDPRVLTIKMKVQYPNVSKGQNEYMFKWVNMRYDISHMGNVKLQPLPRFKAVRKPSGRGLTTEGMIKGLSGSICKFSYGQLAVLLKKVIENALKILAGETSSIDPSALMTVHPILDVVNLIWKTTAKFEIVSAQSATMLGPLFSAVAPTTVDAFKINDEDVEGLQSTYYVVFGMLKNLEDIINGSQKELTAFRAENFQLEDVNLYGQIDEDAPIFALLFTTRSETRVGDQERVIFENGVHLLEYEILNEDEILANFL